MPAFAQTPDGPKPFGYKTSWFAVKTSDPAAVVAALEFGEATPANWRTGLSATSPDKPWRRQDRWVFVSPPVDGWVLVIGFSLPYPATIELQQHIGRKFDVLFSRLMNRFEDVQFFGSYRVVGFVAWARALKGKPVRIFSYADGEVFANTGVQTPEEARLRFANVTGLSPPDARDRLFQISREQDTEVEALRASGLTRREVRARILQTGWSALPNEGDVVELAALWSIDPTQLKKQEQPSGLGLAVRLPKDFQQ